MYILQRDKKSHPEYQEYIELHEEVLTSLESGARGHGAPEAIIAACLKVAQ